MSFTMKNRSNIIMFLDKENDLHDWIMFDFAERKQLPIKTITANKRDLSRLKYTSIIDRYEMLYIKDEDVNIQKSLKDILSINIKKRVLVISVESDTIRKKIERGFKTARIQPYPVFEDYKEKQAYVEKVIRRWKIIFTNKDVERALVRSMMRDITSWEDVKMVWGVYDYRGEKFSEEMLEDLFPDDEFYSLDKYIINVLKGKWKKKGIELGYYYIDKREYSVSWLVSKIQEVYMDIGLFFMAYRGGVILIPESAGRITERVDGLGWENGRRLAEFSEIDQKIYIELVKEMPYSHYVKTAKHVMGLNQWSTETDLYKMIENIKIERAEGTDEWDEPEFNRKRT